MRYAGPQGKDVKEVGLEPCVMNMQNENTTYNLVERLRKRAEIRRQIPTRKSVQENKPDRIADLLEEAAFRIETLESYIEGV